MALAIASGLKADHTALLQAVRNANDGIAIVQIADAIEKAIEPSGVAVTIEAEHLCMKMRGVEKQNSTMKTSVMLGTFRESQATRMEYLQLIADR